MLPHFNRNGRAMKALPYPPPEFPAVARQGTTSVAPERGTLFHGL